MLYFIVNLTSRTGRSKKVWSLVKETLKRENIEYKAYETKGKGHATELARKLSGLEQDTVDLIVVGGDGTINEVLNGIEDFDKVRLGLVPAGSGNDFARGVGIPKDTEAALERILKGIKAEKEGESAFRRIDTGRVLFYDESGTPVEDRRYGISSGLGMDAIVCKKSLSSKMKNFLNRIHLGKLIYLVLTVQTLFSMTTTKATVRCTSGENTETEEYEKIIFLAAMNLKAEGGGVPMAPKAVADDGSLHMCLAHGVPKWRTFLILPVLVMAKHEKLKCFASKKFEKCEVQLQDACVLHADGEYLGEFKSVCFECIPGKLQILG